jgi:hypothetical protein
VIEIKVGEYRVSLGAGSIIYANNAIIAQVLVMPNLRVGMILFDASGNLRMKVLEVQQEDPSANEPTVLEFPIEIGKDYDVDYVSVSGQRLTKYDKLLAIIKPFRQGAIELASQLSMDIRDQMGRVEYLGGETFNEGLPYLRCHLLARDGSAWLGALFGERRSLKLRFTTRIEGEQYGSWG